MGPFVLRNAMGCGGCMIQGAVLLTVGRSYVGNYITHSTLLDRACVCSYKNLPEYCRLLSFHGMFLLTGHFFTFNLCCVP